MTFRCPDEYRVRLPNFPIGDDRNGFFIVGGLRIIASDGMGWEH